MKRKHEIFSAVLFFCLIVLSGSGYAQSVFLKDGSIVEGKIITENDVFLTIKTEKESKNIKRSEIIRTVYNNDFKTRVNVVLMDGRIIKGYVVEESKNYYVIRKYLDSTKELKLEKSKINGILKDDVAIKKDEPAADSDISEQSDDGSPVVISTDKSTYSPNEKIIIRYSNMPGGRWDWIAISKKGTSDDTYEIFDWTNRRVEGELIFKKGLPSGEYEVRVYLDWAYRSYRVSKRYSFRVKSN
jgi:hypothetical protein